VGSTGKKIGNSFLFGVKVVVRMMEVRFCVVGLSGSERDTEFERDIEYGRETLLGPPRRKYRSRNVKSEITRMIS
tara:strand:+ start:1611 stop:1835 length:225 start_codon:yes stop_codon:yes gene_type:complete